MLQNDNKVPSDSHINENNSLSSDLNNPNPSFDNFYNQNQLNILKNNNSSLNNNRLLSPLLINNINIEKELYNINNQSKPIISEGKTYYIDLPSENTSNYNINNSFQDLFFNEINPFKNTKIPKQKKKLRFHKKPTGRFKKESKKDGKHNKYSDDNVRKKVKHLVLKSIMKFLNRKIKELFNNNIGHNVLKKELLTLNKIPKFESSIEYNKLLLNKTIKEIFSENIQITKRTLIKD